MCDALKGDKGQRRRDKLRERAKLKNGTGKCHHTWKNLTIKSRS